MCPGGEEPEDPGIEAGRELEPSRQSVVGESTAQVSRSSERQGPRGNPAKDPDRRLGGRCQPCHCLGRFVDRSPRVIEIKWFVRHFQSVLMAFTPFPSKLGLSEH